MRESNQALRDRFGGMVAVLRHLDPLRDVVRALPMARGACHQPDFDG